MRPGPPNATARPTAIPASAARSTPPAPSGGIDAANALAECVAIGDLSTLRDIADPSAAAKQKFVVPSIPAMSGRTKPQSTAPPISTSRTATTLGVGPLPKPVEEPAVVAATASRDDSTQPIELRRRAARARDDRARYRASSLPDLQFVARRQRCHAGRRRPRRYPCPARPHR